MAPVPNIDAGAIARAIAGAIAVTSLDDPRLDDYRSLKDRHLEAESGKFIAESELVVRKLLASGLSVESVLLTPARLRTLVGALPSGMPVYLAPQHLLDGIAGFHVHRGCLAVGRRPTAATIPEDARTVVVLEDLVDVENLGGLVRNAAAFGADAMLLSPRCADPFYRKAIRVSVGSVFAIPIVRAVRWPDDLTALRERHGLTIVGAVLDTDAAVLSGWEPPARVAIVLGSEGPGLSAAARATCDALVTIPMAAGADSLNVATAGAVVLYHLGQCRRA